LKFGLPRGYEHQITLPGPAKQPNSFSPPTRKAPTRGASLLVAPRHVPSAAAAPQFRGSSDTVSELVHCTDHRLSSVTTKDHVQRDHEQEGAEQPPQQGRMNPCPCQRAEEAPEKNPNARRAANEHQSRNTSEVPVAPQNSHTSHGLRRGALRMPSRYTALESGSNTTRHR
jgi:hypothetical protein